LGCIAKTLSCRARRYRHHGVSTFVAEYRKWRSIGVPPIRGNLKGSLHRVINR
jgi:hypothetical protein